MTRILLAPVFFLVSKVPEWTNSAHLLVFILLFLLFLAAEISDLVDGYLARKLNLVSPIGKILDPFSDVVTHLTIFFVLVNSGVLIDLLFMGFVLRELGIILVRMILMGEGTALGASSGGKIKSLMYAIGSGVGLVAMGNHWLKVIPLAQEWLVLATNIIVGFGVLLAWVSFAAYFKAFLQRSNTSQDK